MHNLSIFLRPIIHRARQNLSGTSPINLNISGGPLMGKSVVLGHLRQHLSEQPVVWINCAELSPNAQPPAPPEESGRWVLLVDNAERMAEWSPEAQSCWSGWLAAQQPDRSVVLASAHPLHEWSADNGLHSIAPHFQHSFLGLIDREESRRIIAALLDDQSHSAPLLDPLLDMCGGHPFLLDRMDELLADVAGLLPGGGPLMPDHLPLVRMRLAATHGQILFGNQWRAVHRADARPGWAVGALLAALVRRPIPLDGLTPAQMGPMNWLLVQGMVRIDGHFYRLFSPLLQEYLALRLEVTPVAEDSVQAAVDSAQALVEREAHRFTPQEKTLLFYFLERPGVIVSVDELLAEVWERPDGSVRRVQEGIRRLRHRLTELSRPVGAIENEWGQGYRYVPVNGVG